MYGSNSSFALAKTPFPILLHLREVLIMGLKCLFHHELCLYLSMSVIKSKHKYNAMPASVFLNVCLCD